MPVATITPDLSRRAALAADALREHGWAVLEGFVTGTFVDELRAEARVLRADGRFRAAGVGRGAQWRLDASLRGDEVLWVDPEQPTPCQRRLLGAMERLRKALNGRLTLGLFEYEAHLAVYPPGAAYCRHRDHFRGTQDRLVTTTLYLNEGWTAADGGQLRLFPEGREPVEVTPEGGTLVFFLSQALEHEVLPARRERWSWTGWFRRRPG